MWALNSSMSTGAKFESNANEIEPISLMSIETSSCSCVSSLSQSSLMSIETSSCSYVSSLSQSSSVSFIFIKSTIET